MVEWKYFINKAGMIKPVGNLPACFENAFIIKYFFTPLVYYLHIAFIDIADVLTFFVEHFEFRLCFKSDRCDIVIDQVLLIKGWINNPEMVVWSHKEDL